jgi:cell wall-associated NlpC family hydrolase
MRVLSFLCCSVLFLFASCDRSQNTVENKAPARAKVVLIKNDIVPVEIDDHISIHTNNIAPAELVNYAETLTGIPYKYGSTDPGQGFDCSGFITYVFNHFKIAVPRSSIDFTNVEREVELRNSKRGDLILFTGTDSTIRAVGHMGIITSLPGKEITFIHSTSGKAYSVTTTPLNSYYQGRFVKALRIFKQNDMN